MVVEAFMMIAVSLLYGVERPISQVQKQPSLDGRPFADSLCRSCREDVLDDESAVIEREDWPVVGLEARGRGETDPIDVGDATGLMRLVVTNEQNPGRAYGRSRPPRVGALRGDVREIAETAHATNRTNVLLETEDRGGCDAGQDQADGEDLADVGRVLDAFVKAFNTQDSVALSRLFVPEGVLHDWRGRVATSSAQIRRSYEEAFSEILSTRPYTLEDGRTVVLQRYPLVAPKVTLLWERVSAWAGDGVSIDGRWCTRGALGPTGAVLPDVARDARGATGSFRINLRREGGKWAILHLSVEAPYRPSGAGQEEDPQPDSPPDRKPGPSSSNLRFFDVSKRLVVTEQPPGLFILGRVKDGRFVPAGEIEGAGQLADEGSGTPGWVELATGVFYMMATARAMEAPYLEGVLGEDGLFRPFTLTVHGHRDDQPHPTIGEFRLERSGDHWLLVVTVGERTNRLTVPLDFASRDAEWQAAEASYVSSTEFDEAGTPFAIGDGRIGVHFSSYSISDEGSAGAAAGRDVFLVWDPETFEVIGTPLELGITKDRHRAMGCWHASYHTFLVGDVNRDGLSDVGAVAERIWCEERNQEGLDVVAGPFHAREPVRWRLYQGGRWTHDPAFDGQFPSEYRELPAIGLIKSPIEYVQEALGPQAPARENAGVPAHSTGPPIRYVVSGGITGRGGVRLSISEEGVAKLESSTPPIERRLDPQEYASLLEKFAGFVASPLLSAPDEDCPDGFVHTVTYGETKASMSDCARSSGKDLPQLRQLVNELSVLARRLLVEAAPWSGLEVGFGLDRDTYGVGERVRLLGRIRNPTDLERHLYLHREQPFWFMVSRQGSIGFRNRKPPWAVSREAGRERERTPLRKLTIEPGLTETLTFEWDQVLRGEGGEAETLEPGRYRIRVELLDTSEVFPAEEIEFDVVDRRSPLVCGVVQTPDHSSRDRYTFTMLLRNWTQETVSLRFPHRQRFRVKLFVERRSWEPRGPNLELLYEGPAELEEDPSSLTLPPGETVTLEEEIAKRELVIPDNGRAYPVTLELLDAEYRPACEGDVLLFRHSPN